MVQKSRQLELPLESKGEALRVRRSGQASLATSATTCPGTDSLMEEALSRSNLKRAWKRVKRNGGSPGIDGMTVDELVDWLWGHWSQTREELLAGRYQPQPVLRVEIPERGGGMRKLGIPTVVDRLIQQALLQVLQPRFDPSFSEHSHGFRPGRRAHDAICEARQYVQEGRRWVVDVDLEKFFDRVNHDVLMGRLAQRIEDRRVLRLIRRYLAAGVMADGVVLDRHEGTPQGGPLSRLLANVLLDEVDRELERRGHCFVRYADDLRVFVGSRKAGERVMRSLIGLFGKLRLRVNESKSAVDKAWRRPFLGFAFWVGPKRHIYVRVSREALGPLERPRPQAHASHAWAEHDRDRGGVAELSARVEGLLLLGRDTQDLPQIGRMDPPSSAGLSAQAMEAVSYRFPCAARPRYVRDLCRSRGCQRSVLVAQLTLALAQCAPKLVSGRAGLA